MKIKWRQIKKTKEKWRDKHSKSNGAKPRKMVNHDFNLNHFPNDMYSQSNETHAQTLIPDIVMNYDNEPDVDDLPEIEDEEEEIAEGETVEVEDGLDSENISGNYETFEDRRPMQMLNNNQKQMVYTVLLQKSVNGVLKKTHTTEVSNLFKLPLRTVQRIWERHKKTSPGTQVDVSQKRSKNSGRKRDEIDINLVLALPLSKRTTLRSTAAALGVNHSKIFRLFKEGRIRRHTNTLKPLLSDEHKRARLQFCTSMIESNYNPQEPKFAAMYNYIHIDEKWFYMTKQSESYYLLPDEEEPVRRCQSKNYIGKVMFLVAMARPRFDVDGNEVFSGKIGVFPFIKMIPAQRRSRNRVAGTLEMKPITSVTREVVRTCLIDEVLPAIRNVWPQGIQDEVIYIQQDNARTHIDPSDEQFQIAVAQSGLNIQLICQPPNSPDMNILDLGFFSAIQSLQYKEVPKNVEELVQAVVKSFNGYPSNKVNHVWLTLQLCMQETMKHGGSNTYKIPHMKKLQLERNGQLPIQISCDPQVLQTVQDILSM